MKKDEIFENNELITIYTDVNVILRRPVCTCSVLKLSNVHWIYVRLFAYVTTYFSTLVHNMVPNTVEILYYDEYFKQHESYIQMNTHK